MYFRVQSMNQIKKANQWIGMSESNYLFWINASHKSTELVFCNI